MDVLETVRLLDESDRLLGPPAALAPLGDPPHQLERPVDVEQCQERHRRAPKAVRDNHVQLLLRMDNLASVAPNEIGTLHFLPSESKVT